MASVSARARVRKSAGNPKCPKCGSTLITERDDDRMTTLRCPQCSKRRVAEWLAEDESCAVVRKAARKVRGLAMSDIEDITSEITLALLEHDKPVSPDAETFVEWLDELAYAVAGRMRTGELSQPGRPVDAEVLQAVAESEADDLDEFLEPQFTHAAEMEKWIKNRAARIRRAMGKLTADHRDILIERFFKGGNLAASARGDAGCDSRNRTRLWRAKKKLGSLIDSSGYALSA